MCRPVSHHATPCNNPRCRMKWYVNERKRDSNPPSPAVMLTHCEIFLFTPQITIYWCIIYPFISTKILLARSKLWFKMMKFPCAEILRRNKLNSCFQLGKYKKNSSCWHQLYLHQVKHILNLHQEKFAYLQLKEKKSSLMQT